MNLLSGRWQACPRGPCCDRQDDASRGVTGTTRDHELVDITKIDTTKPASEQVIFLNASSEWVRGEGACVNYMPGDKVRWSPLDWVGIYYKDAQCGEEPIASHWAPCSALNKGPTAPRTIVFDGGVLSTQENETKEFTFMYVDMDGQTRGTSSPLCLKHYTDWNWKSFGQILSDILPTWDVPRKTKHVKIPTENFFEEREKLRHKANRDIKEEKLWRQRKNEEPPTDSPKQTSLPRQESPPVLFWHPHPLAKQTVLPMTSDRTATFKSLGTLLEDFSTPRTHTRVPRGPGNHHPPGVLNDPNSLRSPRSLPLLEVPGLTINNECNRKYPVF